MLLEFVNSTSQDGKNKVGVNFTIEKMQITSFLNARQLRLIVPKFSTEVLCYNYGLLNTAVDIIHMNRKKDRLVKWNSHKENNTNAWKCVGDVIP